MRRFICATHGNFSEGILNSLKLIIGEVENIYAITAYTSEKSDLQYDISELLCSFSEDDDVVVITDIFGGSVNNEWMRIMMNSKRIHLISGLNLPLLIDLVLNDSKETDIEKLIISAMDASLEGYKYCNILKTRQELKFEDF